MYKILDTINTPKDLNKLSIKQLKQLAKELRKKINSLSQVKAMHLSSNLGIVEIAIANLIAFNLPKDKVFYDTGHQSYIHKILTGRKDKIFDIRAFKGISGFQDPKESIYDVFSGGHSGNAISTALGMSYKKKTGYIVPIIGDAAMVNGESFEALNNINKRKKLIIILNDNGMSISKSIGEIKNVFSKKIKSKKFFENFGLKYFGIINGNDIEKVLTTISEAKKASINGPVIIHFHTRKGLGNKVALNDSVGKYHMCSPNNFSLVPFGIHAANKINELIEKDKLVNVINPAMNIGTSFNICQNKFPKNYYDVGISEEHACSFAAGMSIVGLKPVVVYFSTFLQRAFDQIIHDVARINLPLLFLVDRCELSPNDGPTHHGIYELNVLKNIPNCIITTARNYDQLIKLIDLGYQNKINPFFIRYTRLPYISSSLKSKKINFGDWEYLINKKNKICIISYGPYIDVIYKTLKNKNVDLINAVFLSQYKLSLLEKILKKYSKILVYERVNGNPLGNDFIVYANKIKSNCKIQLMSYHGFIEHGDYKNLDLQENMDANSILKNI